jgi:hypothetical protein
VTPLHLLIKRALKTFYYVSGTATPSKLLSMANTDVLEPSFTPFTCELYLPACFGALELLSMLVLK